MIGFQIRINDIALSLKTPAFVYDEERIISEIDNIRGKIEKTSCKLLFPLKSFTSIDALYSMSTLVEGFSVSSLFEAKLARDVLGNCKSVHITTPGFRPDEIDEVSELCDYISFNSLSQWERYHAGVNRYTSCGIRINPQLSFVKDTRYDPCRKHSKLGVPLNNLSEIFNNSTRQLENVRGLHFHTNSESTDFNHLLRTIKHIETHLSKLLEQVDWVNMGGGYLFENACNVDKLIEAVALLKNRYYVEVFLEPGKGIIGSAGYIISSVIDLFENDGRTIAILDTTVNHMPEVFEYQYQPDVLGHCDGARYRYILAGCTCLAGDEFGEYAFGEPLEVGSQIVFLNAGAYTLVKAHMFNGVNLPNIYAYTQEGKLELKRQFGYEDFISRCGVSNNVSV